MTQSVKNKVRFVSLFLYLERLVCWSNVVISGLIHLMMTRVYISCSKAEINNSRKFAVYNFTIYDTASEIQIVTCAVNALLKGEIVLCMSLRLFSWSTHIQVSREVTHFHRRAFNVLYIYIAAKYIHNYFDSRHSQMEGDAIHASIKPYAKTQGLYLHQKGNCT